MRRGCVTLYEMYKLFLRSYFRPVALILFSACNTVLWAQPPATDHADHGCSQRAGSFLNERLTVWQQRLKLQDWKISILMSHPGELRASSLGNIRWDATKKSAVIRVLAPAAYHLACGEMLADMEFTVVHELIHLELSSLPRSEASRREEEHAVNHITAALLALDRGKQELPHSGALER